jgi:hypothetical protein
MRWFISFLCFSIFTLLACYLSIWVCFIGGLVNIIEAIKSNPVNAPNIALGMLKLISSTLIGWGIFITGIYLSSRIYDKN